MIKIATWNVNSVRARLSSLQEWFHSEIPDVLLLQELKCQETAFPFSFFEEFGYTCRVLGQKTYNGVAIVTKTSIEDVTIGLPTFPEDIQARYIEAVVQGSIRVASLYLPNGGTEVEGHAYIYKCQFLQKLKQHLATLKNYDEAIYIGGDFNIAPQDRDVYNPKLWQGRVCCTDKERHLFSDLKNEGFEDVMAKFWNNSGNRPFTWWDYRSAQSVAQDRGLRLDLFLANPKAMDRIQNISVNKAPRLYARPSDHAPVVIQIQD